jgi:8-oxo-dGTP pyrophosphatase MutT (NUDIX family)
MNISTPPKELPLMVEGIIFRKVNNMIEVLCLHRSKGDGGYWQPLTGHTPSNESIRMAVERELLEETGITNPIAVYEDIWHFHWEWDGEMYLEYVYAVEVAPDQEIVLEPKEHDSYKWCSIDEAVELFRHENNKSALQHFQTFLSGL